MARVKCIVLVEWAVEFEEAAKECGYDYELIENEMDRKHVMMDSKEYHSTLAAMPQDHAPDVIGAEEWQRAIYDELGDE